MRVLLPARALTLVLLGIALPAGRAAEFGLFKNYWGDVLVATDMTPEGRALQPPTPENPVYYRGRSLGPRLGSIRGDQEPDINELTAAVTRILAKQGYVGARPGVHEPSLYLVVQWGYLTPGSEDLIWFLGYNPADDIGAPVFPGMLGPEVFRRGMRSRLVETILENARDPIYGIIVTAFDYKTAKTPEPTIYWQTRIGLPANGKTMAEALPVMLIAAGPSIGQPRDRPTLVDADRIREGRIKLGELRILDIVDDRALETDGAKKK